MLELLLLPETWAALITLIALEIVLGIDNIIFISILVGRLPDSQRDLARKLGLGLAMGTRLLLLFSLVAIMKLVEPWFEIFGREISGRDLILIGGGLFLLAKSTHEIHSNMEDVSGNPADSKASGFASVLVQIAILDIVFSLDSVITAVGMADHLFIMATAIIISVGVMLVSARSIGEFVDRHPTIKMLALSFLILIGVTLIAEGMDVHVPKGYIYFAMAFSFLVEMLNLRVRGKKTPAS